MNENDTAQKENNAEEESKNHLQWLSDVRLALWEDLKIKIREIKTWMEIAAFSVVVTYTFVSCNQWKTAERQLEASERPWIKINTIEMRDGSTGPIKTLSFQNGVPSLQIKVTYTNVGHSVAQSIQVWPELFSDHFENYTWADKVIREEKQFCKSIAGRTPFGDASIVFPSDISETNVAGSGRSMSGVAAATLIICINYQGAADTHYQTQAIAGLYKDRLVIIPIGEDADASRLKLIRQEYGDHAY